MARIRGDVTIVGAAGGTFGLGLYTAPYAMNLRSVMWGGRTELAEVLALATLGRISPIYECFPLSQALTAYTRLRAHQVRGRGCGRA